MSDKPIAVIGTHVNKGGYYEMTHEHKGDVMQRRFEYQELGGKHGIFEGNLLVAVVGECFARPESAGDVAREMTRVWNEHDALVEQRDRYARALEVIRDSFWSEDEPAEERVEHLQQLATDALATVEQGGEA